MSAGANGFERRGSAQTGNGDHWRSVRSEPVDAGCSVSGIQLVFSAQIDNPGDAKFVPGRDPSMATDPLVSTFGGWQAVENAALALTESTNLLLTPGRTCANGLPVPTNNPDWPKLVQELRDAGMKAYKAAQSKNQDNI